MLVLLKFVWRTKDLPIVSYLLATDTEPSN